MQFLSSTAVRDIIKSRDTRIATVTFLKNDGTVRTANGLFRPSSHIVGSERGYRQSEEMKARGQVPFYDLHKKAWISFYETKVLNVK